MNKTGEKLTSLPLEKPIGDFIFNQKDIEPIVHEAGNFYHYSQVCELLKRYASQFTAQRTCVFPTDDELAAELLARFNGNSRGNPIAKKAFTDAVLWLKERQSKSSQRTCVWVKEDEAKTKYVCGFAFDNDMKYIALIEKKKPKWQEGKFNGIGGKVEPKESSVSAMLREFVEEAGVQIEIPNWNYLITISGEDWLVDFYYTLADNEDFDDISSQEVEKISIIPINSLDHYDLIENLYWLIPMCIDLEKTKTKARTLSSCGASSGEGDFDFSKLEIFQKEPVNTLLVNALRHLNQGQIKTLADSLYERTPKGEGEDELKSAKRSIKFCTASINGALDGLQLDNTCDVVEKTLVIEQLNELLVILQPPQSK